MPDAPPYRIWPPVALGVPLLVGIAVTATVGDPVELPAAAARLVGGVLLVERYLSAEFGAEYDAYRHRTRRWC